MTEATARRVERIDQLINNFLSYPLTGDQKALATQFASNWRTLRDKGFRPVAQLLQANNLSEAQWVVTQTIEPTATAVKSEGAQLRELQLASAQAEYNRALSTSRIV
ncbi:Tar ligand binding domain-containing protein, partial [Escherichia coli]|nr:Tar ligand binding domain-containing protein [Escherichia coli]